MSEALEPAECTRCKELVPHDAPTRPEFLTSREYVPQFPRPVMGDGTPVSWQVEGDYSRHGRVAATLCPACLQLLAAWLYLGEAAPART